MLTSKQRAYLRGLANTLQPVLIIGKDGISEALLQEVDQALECHELIKIKLLESSFLSPKGAAAEISEQLGADPVQCIGSKIVLYRESKENKQIELI
jgi:RNA-binding protein